MKERSGERSAACATCGKTFARSDTLLRHEKSHHASEDRGPVHRVTSGTFRACCNCAAARSRCSGGTPCGRCNLRKMDCTYPNKRRKGSSMTEVVKAQEASPKQQQANTFTETVFASNDQPAFHDSGQIPTLESSTMPILQDAVHNPGTRTSFSSHQGYRDQFPANNIDMSRGIPGVMEMPSIPSMPGQVIQHDQFSEPSMTVQYQPGYGENTSSYDYGPWDESLNWIPLSIYPSPFDAELEQDFSFILPPLSDTPNLGTDFNQAPRHDPLTHSFHQTPAIAQQLDQRSESLDLPASVIAFGQSPASSASDGVLANKSVESGSSVNDGKRKRRKSTVFPDLFMKPRNDKTTFAFPDMSAYELFTPSNVLGLCQQDDYNIISNTFQKLCVESVLPNQFESARFPDITSLDACIDLYFENFHSTFPLLHKPTFGLQTHWIVVLAVAAVGSTFARAHYALDLRDAFQEFLRRAIYQSANDIGDFSLDIPLAQARILNLIGLTQSDRDQLRSLAPRSHADLSRWCLESGILQIPETGDLNDLTSKNHITTSLHQKWDLWIRTESLRRIGYMIWLMDSCLGYMANARPLCNMDDARTPMPCPEPAWSSPSPEIWWTESSRMLKSPSLCAALETLYAKKSIDPNLSEISQILLIHALYQRTWEVGTHIKQPLSEWVPTGKAKGFLNTPSKDNFWLPLYPLYANWRNSACDCLDVLHWHASSMVAKAAGVEHGLVLHLHLARIILLTPFQEIQDLIFSLVGKVGNGSKASYYVHDGSYQPRNKAKLSQIRKITWRWLREDQHKARLAMIHAGSVFWHVRRYSSANFFEPLAIYLASIVLWTYGSYKSAALERDAVAAANVKPVGGPSGPDADGSIVQPSRVERKCRGSTPYRHSATSKADEDMVTPGYKHTPSDSEHSENHQSTSEPRAPTLLEAGSDRTSPNMVATDQHQDKDDCDEVESSSASDSDEQPEFIHLDRPCDDEMVQHFVRNGHNMSGHMSNVGDICKSPQKVLTEGAKLLRTKLSAWGVSREYYEILTWLGEMRRGN